MLTTRRQSEMSFGRRMSMSHSAKRLPRVFQDVWQSGERSTGGFSHDLGLLGVIGTKATRQHASHAGGAGKATDFHAVSALSLATRARLTSNEAATSLGRVKQPGGENLNLQMTFVNCAG